MEDSWLDRGYRIKSRGKLETKDGGQSLKDSWIDGGQRTKSRGLLDRQRIEDQVYRIFGQTEDKGQSVDISWINGG